MCASLVRVHVDPRRLSTGPMTGATSLALGRVTGTSCFPLRTHAARSTSGLSPGP